MSRIDNPPAFPLIGVVRGSNEGMSLRDYFAAQALYGLHGVPIDIGEAESVARRVYMMADAMLAARATGGDA